MGKRGGFFLVVTCSLVLGVPAIVCWRAGEAALHEVREPAYKGRRLSTWLETFQNPWYDATMKQENEAIRALGTDCIPVLLQWVQTEPPVRSTNWYAIVNAVLIRLNRNWELKDKVRLRINGAINAFHALGWEAQEAVPELSRLLLETKSKAVARQAARALMPLGAPAFPARIAGLTNQDPGVRAIAASGFQRYGGANAHTVLPLLIQCLSETNEHVAAVAACTLGGIRPQEPTTVVSALTNALHHASSRVRIQAILSVNRYGRHARSALPALIRCLQDTNATVAQVAVQGLINMPEDAELVLPLLTNCLYDPRWEVRDAATRSLGYIFPTKEVREMRRMTLRFSSYGGQRSSPDGGWFATNALLTNAPEVLKGASNR